MLKQPEIFTTVDHTGFLFQYFFLSKTIVFIVVLLHVSKYVNLLYRFEKNKKEKLTYCKEILLEFGFNEMLIPMKSTF